MSVCCTSLRTESGSPQCQCPPESRPCLPLEASGWGSEYVGVAGAHRTRALGAPTTRVLPSRCDCRAPSLQHPPTRAERQRSGQGSEAQGPGSGGMQPSRPGGAPGAQGAGVECTDSHLGLRITRKGTSRAPLGATLGNVLGLRGISRTPFVG